MEDIKLDNLIINKLTKAQYDSAEAAQEAQEAANSLAEEYPDLIKSYDDQGNAIVEVADQEKLLAKLRRESADAAYEASLKEMEIKEAELEIKSNIINTIIGAGFNICRFDEYPFHDEKIPCKFIIKAKKIMSDSR